MQVLPISSNSIEEAIQIIRSGGVVAHPTDTCYGLTSNIFDSEAVKKVIDIKKMSSDKPISIAVKNMEEMEKYGILNAKAKTLAEKYLPGALTFILPKTQNLPDTYFPNTNLIGIRVLDFSLMIQILERLEYPVTTTSANITTIPEVYTAKDLVKMLENEKIKPDLVLSEEGTEYEGRDPQKPSTIVKVVGDEILVLREGSIKITNL